MKSSSRYIFISIFIGIFLIVAPLIVIFVSGSSINFWSKTLHKTGIFTVETEPDNAILEWDGKVVGQTPKTIRFLKRGQYTAKISKPGYFDWNKSFYIELDKVTFGQINTRKLFLIKNSGEKQISDQDFANFIVVDNKIWASEANILYQINLPHSGFWTNLSDTSNPASYKFPSNISSIQDIGYNWLMIEQENSWYLFNTKTFQIVSPAFSSNKPKTVQFISRQQALIQLNEQLVLFDTENNADKILEDKVAGIASSNDNIFIARKSTSSIEISSQTWNGSQFLNYTLIGSIPTQETSQFELIANKQNQIFALASGRLIKIEKQNTELASNVSQAWLDSAQTDLIYKTPSELWVHNSLLNLSNLVLRTQETINFADINKDIGYIFTASQQGFEAIELDSRDQKNRYQITKNSPVIQFVLDEEIKGAVLLSGSKLVFLEIYD